MDDNRDFVEIVKDFYNPAKCDGWLDWGVRVAGSLFVLAAVVTFAFALFT